MYSQIKQMPESRSVKNITVLLRLALLCPIGNSIVERLFSLMKLVKTPLRNLLSDPSLDSLLRINKEAPETLSEQALNDLIDLLREHRENLSESGKTRLQF